MINSKDWNGRQKKVRTMVGSKYCGGEGVGMGWCVYSGEVGELIGWNGNEADISGENEGLGCGEAKEGFD